MLLQPWDRWPGTPPGCWASLLMAASGPGAGEHQAEWHLGEVAWGGDPGQPGDHRAEHSGDAGTGQVRTLRYFSLTKAAAVLRSFPGHNDTARVDGWLTAAPAHTLNVQENRRGAAAHRITTHITYTLPSLVIQPSHCPPHTHCLALACLPLLAYVLRLAFWPYHLGLRVKLVVGKWISREPLYNRILPGW